METRGGEVGKLAWAAALAKALFTFQAIFSHLKSSKNCFYGRKLISWISWKRLEFKDREWPPVSPPRLFALPSNPPLPPTGQKQSMQAKARI